MNGCPPPGPLLNGPWTGITRRAPLPQPSLRTRLEPKEKARIRSDLPRRAPGAPFLPSSMSLPDHPNSRPRRSSRNQGRSHHRSPGSRSPNRSDRPDRPDHAPREDHRDWEPVDRGRDIRRRAAEKPSLFQKILAALSFGLLGNPKKSPADRASSSFRSGDRPDRSSRAPRENRPPRSPREPRPITPPDPEAVTSPRLHVGNLSYDAAESDLTELFSGVGQVQSIEVVYHRDTQRSKGFAFVQMLTLDEAKRAVAELHGKDYLGRQLEIGAARLPTQSRDGERRPPRREFRD